MLLLTDCWTALKAQCHPGSTRVTEHLFKHKDSLSIMLLAVADSKVQVTDVGVPMARGVFLVFSVNLPLNTHPYS